MGKTANRGLFLRGGVYYGRTKNEHGKWIKRTLNTGDAIVARARFRELERREADPSYRAANEASIADAVADFVASRVVKGCAAGTMHMYRVKTAHLLRLVGGKLPLAALDAPRVDKYIAARLAEGAGRNTIGKELTALRGLLKVAQRAGKFPRPLFEVLPTEWSNDYEPRKTALTAEQSAALVRALAAPASWVDAMGRSYTRDDGASERMNKAAFVAFSIATGARLSEARRAVRSQIDLKRGLVYFLITKTKKKGKREKYVPVTDLTRGLLEQVLAATAGKGTGVPMFAPWANMTRDLAKVCKALDIPRVTANDLRRTHANWLVAGGVPLNFVADVLGHVDSRMVERVYGRLRPEQLRERVLAIVTTSQAVQ